MILSTITRLKTHLGIPVTDLTKNSLLEMLLKGASEFIEGQTARKLELQSHVVKISGDGTDELILPHYPIFTPGGVPSIESITMDGVAVSIASLDVDSETAILYHPDKWTNGKRNIVVTYVAGYVVPGNAESGEEDASTVPGDLELAAIRLAARVYERRMAEGTTSVSPASYSVNYKDSMDSDIEATIGRHSRVRVG